MNKGEKAQFVVGVLLWAGFPIPFMQLGGEYLLALIGITAAVSGAFLLH